jgi:tRNA-dihydrouridine synthase B
MMAEAARFNVDRGAQVIDINMGCPAKKVCNVAAGSALMGNEALALRIVEAVTQAVDVPVTVKMRTGLDRTRSNAVALARGMASAGAALITVHGRSRACAFQGQAEYDTIAEVKQAVCIPVVANGDIDTPAKAAWVMARTGADAVMIGRAGQGNPWLYRQVAHFLAHGELLPDPGLTEIRQVLHEHLEDHYAFHGPVMGPRIARKHIGWYVGHWADRMGLNGRGLLDAVNQADDPEQQLKLLDEFLCASEDEIAVH